MGRAGRREHGDASSRARGWMYRCDITSCQRPHSPATACRRRRHPPLAPRWRRNCTVGAGVLRQHARALRAVPPRTGRQARGGAASACRWHAARRGGASHNCSGAVARQLVGSPRRNTHKLCRRGLAMRKPGKSCADRVLPPALSSHSRFIVVGHPDINKARVSRVVGAPVPLSSVPSSGLSSGAVGLAIPRPAQ